MNEGAKAMIPEWNIANVLPPIRPGAQGHSSDRSPYKVTLTQVVERFALSVERMKVLQGLLAYRHELHQIGIEAGFQWLDGSFMENIETLESRHPNDVDVVSFFHLPEGVDQSKLAMDHAHLFTPDQTKSQFYVDAYACILGQPTTGYHVRTISYWYSMWSHRRDSLWKGFVQVSLSSEEDEEAEKLLKLIQEEEGL